MLGDEKVVLLGEELRSDSDPNDAPMAIIKRKRTRGVNMIKGADDIVSDVFAYKFLMPEGDWFVDHGLGEEPQIMTKRKREEEWDSKGKFHYRVRDMSEKEFDEKKGELEEKFRLAMPDKENNVPHLVTYDKIVKVWQSVCTDAKVEKLAKTDKAHATRMTNKSVFDEKQKSTKDNNVVRDVEVEKLIKKVRTSFDVGLKKYRANQSNPFVFPVAKKEAAKEMFELCDDLLKEVEESIDKGRRKDLTTLVELINEDKSTLARNHCDQDWAKAYMLNSRTRDASTTPRPLILPLPIVANTSSAVPTGSIHQNASQQSNSSSASRGKYTGIGTDYNSSRRSNEKAERNLGDIMRKVSGNKVFVAQPFEVLPPSPNCEPLPNAASNQNVAANTTVAVVEQQTEKEYKQ